MSEALPFIGAAVGYMVGGPTGAQYGWMIGAGVSMLTAPDQKSQGPRLEDLSVTGLAYGHPIPYIQGTHRTAGQLIWSSDRREIATTTSQGKGGPKQKNTTYTYEVDCLYLLSSNELAGLLRVWDNGKLAATFDDGATLGSLLASQGTDLWRRITFYGGADDQQPDPTYEAAIGAGYAPAYIGMATVFIEGLQLGQGGQFPNLSFEVGTNLTQGSQQDFQDHGPNLYAVSANAYLGKPLGFLGCVDGQGRFGAAGEFTGGGVGETQGLTFMSGANTPALGASNWTIQCWLRSKGGSYANANGTICSTTRNSTPIQGFWIKFDSDGSLNALFRLDNPGGIYNFALTSGPAAFPLGGLFHFAVERTGRRITAYVNGLPIATADFPADDSLLLFNEPWTVGAMPGGGERGWNGYIDDFAVTQYAIYGEPFVPPQEPYVAGTATLIHIPFFRVDTVERGVETVRATVERLCARAEMPAGSYDASALDAITTPMRALGVTQVGGTRATLDILAQTFHFQAVCADNVYFVPRAQPPVVTIPYKDLGTGAQFADGPEPFALRQRNDLEVLARVDVTYANVLDDYQADTQPSDRILTDQKSTGTMSVPLALTPSEAKAVADARVTDGAISVWSGKLDLPMSYAQQTPGDSVLVEAKDGSVYRMLLGRLTSSNRVLSFEARLEDATAFMQAGITSEDYQPQTEVAATPGTYLGLLDIPQLRDADEGVGMYAVARGMAPSWPGAEVMESTDSLSWASKATITESGVIGTAETALNSWNGGFVFDESSEVIVNVAHGTLSSVTRDDVVNSRTVNAALIGKEVVQFCSAVLLSAGRYRLTRFLRGKLGTDRVMTGHVAGEVFALLQPTGMRRVPQSNADLGAMRYFKGVSIGRALSTAATQQAINTGASSTPLAPVNPRANRDSTDTVITWDRRTRREYRFLGSLGSSVPLGEAVEAYVIEIYTSSAFTTVARTLLSATPSVTYTSAQQVADFGSNRTVLYVRVYQMSETVGRGFPLQATI